VSQKSNRPDWLECDPSGPDPRSETVSSNQAEIKLNVGPGHRLTIPQGAAQPGTRFTVSVHQGGKPGVEIEMEPPATLEKPAELTIRYAHCRQKGKPEEYGIWRVEADGNAARVGGRPVPGQAIAVDLTDFSTYCLAAN
jgi:hypothetical protein